MNYQKTFLNLLLTATIPSLFNAFSTTTLHSQMTSSFAPSLPSVIYQQKRSKSFLYASVAEAEDQTAPNGADAVLREIERKEVAINKQREKAQEKLKKAEEMFQQLQTKKQEYLNGLKLADTPDGGNFKETAVRSAVKAFLWRIVAGSVTFVTSLRFSGSVRTALTIVGSDFFSKALTMFIGERLMNKSQAGRKSGGDAASRSLVKALVWRLFAIANTLTMAIFIAGDLSIASKIAGTDAIFKTALMFFYERIWSKVQWGKEYLIEFSI